MILLSKSKTQTKILSQTQGPIYKKRKKKSISMYYTNPNTVQDEIINK